MTEGDAIAIAVLPPRSKNVYHRERWSSRPAFYFAAVGSAVGFGNIWRFPSLVYEFGGGAFFIPYFLSLLFIGLPILVLEIALGQYYESGDVEVFAGIHPRLRGVGLSSIACGYMGMTYYSLLIAWVTNAFFDSFSNSMWSDENLTESEAVNYFNQQITGAFTAGPDLKPTRIVWANVGYSLFVWFVIYVCVAFGVKVTGRITYFTVGLPIVLLLAILGRSLSLEGASEGVAMYLHTDFSVLSEQPEIWVKACGQVFFSLSICFGAMTAYASHCPRDEPAFRNSCVIAVSNSLFSFVSGFAVFATLGYCSELQGTEIHEMSAGGFGLIFGSFPVALSTLPGGEHWIRGFYLMLFLLGIDSAFSFMDACLVSLNDSALFEGVDMRKTAACVAVVSWLFSLIYATDAGLFLSDVIDYYINFVMLLVGAFQCFAAGWMYNIEEQVDNVGAPLVFTFMSTYFGSIFMGCIVWFTTEGLWEGFVAMVSCLVFGMLCVSYLMKKRMPSSDYWSWRSMIHDLAFRNMLDLRDDLASVVGRIPLIWAVLIKFVIPPVLLILFSLGCAAKTDSGETEFGHYGGYSTSFQLLGILAVVFVGFLFVSNAFVPRLYAGFKKTHSPVKKKEMSLFGARVGPAISPGYTHTSKESADVTSNLESSESPKVASWPPLEC